MQQKNQVINPYFIWVNAWTVSVQWQKSPHGGTESAVPHIKTSESSWLLLSSFQLFSSALLWAATISLFRHTANLYLQSVKWSSAFEKVGICASYETRRPCDSFVLCWVPLKGEEEGINNFKGRKGPSVIVNDSDSFWIKMHLDFIPIPAILLYPVLTYQQDVCKMSFFIFRGRKCRHQIEQKVCLMDYHLIKRHLFKLFGLAACV